jgi:hypothetical protein
LEQLEDETTALLEQVRVLTFGGMIHEEIAHRGGRKCWDEVKSYKCSQVGVQSGCLGGRGDRKEELRTLQFYVRSGGPS